MDRYVAKRGAMGTAIVVCLTRTRSTKLASSFGAVAV